jgi:DnaJ-class molecular chaperone
LIHVSLEPSWIRSVNIAPELNTESYQNIWKGVPDINLGLGDLFVNIKVKIPNNINSEEKEYSKI